MRWMMTKNQQNSHQTIELHKLINEGFVLFDFDYPIWLESAREELEMKILNHYAFREIGFETPAKFKHYFQTRMLEIMPKYVRLYTTTVFKYNPIENYNMIENSEDISKGKDSTDRTNINKDKGNTKFSDTPQGNIDNIDNFMSQAQKTENEVEGSETFTGSRENTENHTLTRKGNIGVTTTQQMIEQERRVLEFDLFTSIIGELRDLFLGVY